MSSHRNDQIGRCPGSFANVYRLPGAVQVLEFTLETLRGEEAELMARIQAREREHGAEGFAEAVVELDKVPPPLQLLPSHLNHMPQVAGMPAWLVVQPQA